MVVIAGKFDEKKALDLVNKTFGAIPKPDRKLDTTYTEEPPQDGERVVTLRRVGDVPVVGVLYHVPSGVDPEYPAVQVLASVLSAAALGPAVQGAGRDQEGGERRGLAAAHARPGRDRDHGRGEQGRAGG